MSNKIDWSKAPEGATHIKHSSLNVGEFTFYDLSKKDAYFFTLATGWEISIWNSEEQKENCTPRPTPQQWNGEGQAPIDTVCNLGKQTVKILCRNGNYVWWKNTASNKCKSALEVQVKFKPLDTRTNKQKAIDDLEKLFYTARPTEEIIDAIIEGKIHGVKWQD